MHTSLRTRKYHNLGDTPKEIIGFPYEKYSYILKTPSFESEDSRYTSKDDITINGEKMLYSSLVSDKIIPIELNSLKEEIIRSKFILSLKDNVEWNEDGNQAISAEMYNMTIDFLIRQCVYIFRQFGIVIKSPEINPCSNGTIDLSWRTEKARLLINIKESPKGYLAYYYGDYYYNESPTKGYVSIDKVSAFLAVWMRDLK